MMNVNDAITKMKSAFKRKYSYLTDEQIEDLYDVSLTLYLSLSFPFDKDIVCIPQEYARDVNIVRLIMTETLEREGMSSLTAYSENGMSFQFSKAHISDTILSLIVPKAKGVVKK